MSKLTRKKYPRKESQVITRILVSWMDAQLNKAVEFKPTLKRACAELGLNYREVYKNLMDNQKLRPVRRNCVILTDRQPTYPDIMGMFIWHESRQGFHYWNRINNKMAEICPPTE